MRCETVEGLLSAYHDSALDTALQQAVEVHLRTCADCSAILADYERFDAVLTAIPPVEPAPELRDRIFSAPEYLALLREHDRDEAQPSDRPTVPTPVVIVPRRKMPAWRRALLPAAAALLLATGGGLVAHNTFSAIGGPTTQTGMPAYGNPGTQAMPLAAGNRVVYLRGGRLWSAAESGNKNTQALTPAGTDVVAWSVSPRTTNGATLVAYVDSDGALSVIRADGQSNQVLYRPGPDSQPGLGFWSTALGGAVRASVQWSPDGQAVSYLVLTGNGQTALGLFNTSATSGTARTFIAGPMMAGAVIANVTWASDSAHLAYTETTSAGTSLWVSDRATGENTEVASTINPSAPTAQPGQVAWAGDTQHPTLTWSATAADVTHVFAWSAGDASPRQLTMPSGMDATVASYSAAAQAWLASDGTRLALLSPTTGKATDAGALGGSLTTVTWNAQGTAAVLTSGNNGFLWAADAPTTTLAREQAPITSVAWAQDGEHLAYATANAVVIAQVHDVNGAWSSTTHKIAIPNAQGLAWAPDGQALAVTRQGGVSLVTATGTTRVVDSSSADGGALTWTVAG